MSSNQTLITKFENAKKKVKIGGKYLHYKGHEYKLIGLALHSETLEVMVIYKPLYKTEADYWVRPFSMWLEKVEVNGKKIPRFQKLIKK